MIRLVSLNIERSKHLQVVIPFLREQQADVVCLQELMEPDIPEIAAALPGASILFTPMTRFMAEGSGTIFGTGLFSTLPVVGSGMEYYVGDAAHMPEQYPADPATFNNENRAFSWYDLRKNDGMFRIATTHFTWTPDGSPSEQQRLDMSALLGILARNHEFVLCGDFNAPRGGEIFSMLAEKYKDNIPPEYKTSIDVNLHRAGKITSEEMDKKMVDGLFSTPEYVVSDVELHSGVSDHMAITATIGKA